ncbi:MAG: hypothetical protein FWD74_01980 [Actinomycetia bacterium]|nr:hypothetical protein [Actinomycetes bacterium]
MKVPCFVCREEFPAAEAKWVDSAGAPTEPNPLWGRVVRAPSPSEREELERWYATGAQPRCPRNHVLPSSWRDVPWLAMVLLGDTGSGKSSYVRGLKRELESGSAAAAFGLTGRLDKASEPLWERRYASEEPTPQPGEQSGGDEYEPVVFEIFSEQSDNSDHAFANLLVFDPAGEATRDLQNIQTSMPGTGWTHLRLVFVSPGAVRDGDWQDAEGTAGEARRRLHNVREYDSTQTVVGPKPLTAIVLSKADRYEPFPEFPGGVSQERHYANESQREVLDEIVRNGDALYRFMDASGEDAQSLLRVINLMSEPYLVAVSNAQFSSTRAPVGILDPLLLMLGASGSLPETPTGRVRP